jgi:hypothetical protein
MPGQTVSQDITRAGGQLQGGPGRRAASATAGYLLAVGLAWLATGDRGESDRDGARQV